MIEEEPRYMEVLSMCLSHQYASSQMPHDPFWSSRDLDLMPNFDFDLSRSLCIFVDASWREKHDTARMVSLTCWIQKLSAKNHIVKTRYFFFHDLWRLTYWP